MILVIMFIMCSISIKYDSTGILVNFDLLKSLNQYFVSLASFDAIDNLFK